MSRLHHGKGLDLLADAFASVNAAKPDVQLVVAGPDRGAQGPFLERIHRLGLASRVHVVGPLYDDAKKSALRDCSAYCLPSRQEAFSIAILEAMAAGAPCVISRACNFPEAAMRVPAWRSILTQARSPKPCCDSCRTLSKLGNWAREQGVWSRAVHLGSRGREHA